MHKKSNIVITGFSGCGKTTIGKLVAQKLGKHFIDTDEIIEKETKMSVYEIFVRNGEAFFRNMEKRAVKDIEKVENTVIACGGGAGIDPENIESLKRTGIIIELIADPAIVIERLLKEQGQRPLIQGKTKEEIMKLYKIRMTCSAQSDIVIDAGTLSPKSVAEKIIQHYRKWL